MEQYQSKPIDRDIIEMMGQIYEDVLKTSDPQSNQCFLLQEKIIYTSIICYESSSNQKEPNQTEKQKLGKIIVNFVQKINKITMQNYEQNMEKKEKFEQKLINKSISLLMVPQVSKYVEQALLIKLKILNFNNISCIYKKLKKYGIALRSINYALELEQKLLLLKDHQERYDIVPTYLNKAAIYSEMKRHRQAIQIILKARTHIQIIQEELVRQIETAIDEQNKQRLIQKRYYGLYMKMIILYNMGAQNEHIRLHSEALDYYKQSKQVALIIGNQLMISKLTNIIETLMRQ